MSARVNVLADAVRTEPGAWTTARARRLYAERGIDAPFRRTARRDLRLLARRGLLTAHPGDGATHYTRRETA